MGRQADLQVPLDRSYGDDGADGTYEANGANIAVTAGTYDMTLDTVNGTYTLTLK